MGRNLVANPTFQSGAPNASGATAGSFTIKLPSHNVIGMPKVAAGDTHSVALKADGTVLTWGSNANGRLGDGTTIDRWHPVEIAELTDIVDIAAGEFHTLAVKADGTVMAWGRNREGQLGDGTTIDRWSPVKVAGLAGVVAVAGGSTHSVALKSDGTVMTWGHNYEGVLGDGTLTDRLSPVVVPSLTEVVAIAAGEYHTVALKADGTVVAWGHNNGGELGDGAQDYRVSPVNVPGLTGVIAVAAGYCTVTLKSDGTVRISGHNKHGSIGDGTFVDRLSPFEMPGLTDVVAVTMGRHHTVALRSDGSAVAWGRNSGGQLGNDTTTQSSIPVVVQELTGAVAVSAGDLHNLALKADGTVLAWGDNASGKLGDGTATTRLHPVNVLGVGGVGVLNLITPPPSLKKPGSSSKPEVHPALNDTGIAASQCYLPGNIILAACGSAEAATLYTNADGLSGRDANTDTNDNSDGRLGFSFTKAPASGSDPGSCVLDNVTGLMWEVKTSDGGLRDKDKVYTNYDSDLTAQKLDGSVPSLAEINASTNSVGFKNSVNAQGLCGFNDWRLPTVDELHGILDYGVADPGPAIDTNWFPNSIGWMYWTASPMVDSPKYAWYAYFSFGTVTYGVRYLASHVRLVRSAQ